MDSHLDPVVHANEILALVLHEGPEWELNLLVHVDDEGQPHEGLQVKAVRVVAEEELHEERDKMKQRSGENKERKGLRDFCLCGGKFPHYRKKCSPL